MVHPYQVDIVTWCTSLITHRQIEIKKGPYATSLNTNSIQIITQNKHLLFMESEIIFILLNMEIIITKYYNRRVIYMHIDLLM